MDAAEIAQVRRFGRLVTQRVGALNDRFLARDRPYGEARLLWEIATGCQDVRALRSRLDLDSGYLSRLLRSLEAAGLITVGASEHDRRVRVAALSEAGHKEVAVYDERSDSLAASFLEPLNADQRQRLVTAMHEVEQLLTAGLVTVAPVDPDHEDARYCRDRFFTEIAHRFENGYDPALSISADGDELRPPQGLLLVARLRDDPVGCGALRFPPGEPAHIRRMWVADSVRGLGIGRRLLAELEASAAEHGHQRIRLETNKALVEAIGMYRAAGYAEVAPHSDEHYAHHWFEKTL